MATDIERQRTELKESIRRTFEANLPSREAQAERINALIESLGGSVAPAAFGWVNNRG
jgi:hypothetical protein